MQELKEAPKVTPNDVYDIKLDVIKIDSKLDVISERLTNNISVSKEQDQAIMKQVLDHMKSEEKEQLKNIGIMESLTNKLDKQFKFIVLGFSFLFLMIMFLHESAEILKIIKALL